MPFSPPPYQLVYHCTVLTCIIELYYCLVLLCICIYPSVYSEYRFISLLLTHMSACVCRKDDLFAYWHWHLLLPICLLPQLLRAVAPALILITSYKLRQVWCFASYHWLFVCWLCCSLCCSVPYFYFRFLNYFPIYYFIWHFKLIIISLPLHIWVLILHVDTFTLNYSFPTHLCNRGWPRFLKLFQYTYSLLVLTLPPTPMCVGSTQFWS